jgi:hypothetical protein
MENLQSAELATAPPGSLGMRLVVKYYDQINRLKDHAHRARLTQVTAERCGYAPGRTGDTIDP